MLLAAGGCASANARCHEQGLDGTSAPGLTHAAISSSTRQARLDATLKRLGIARPAHAVAASIRHAGETACRRRRERV